MFDLTNSQIEKLTANGAHTIKTGKGNHVPVVKLFDPCSGATWLLTDIDPENPDYAFGLCDLGHGSPELGTVYLPELHAHKGALGIGIERDKHWKASKHIEEYAAEARAKGRIAA